MRGIYKPMNQEVPIKDIKPLVEIIDYSIYYFSFSLILIAFGFVAFVYFLLQVRKYFKSQKNPLKSYIKEIINLDTTNAKKFSYDFTKLYNKTTKEVEKLNIKKNDGILDEMSSFILVLETYKYKKDNEVLQDNDIKHFETIIKKLKSIKAFS